MADRATVHHGDCIDVLRTLPDNSVHAVVTDPPYNLAFMGRGWDTHDSPRAFQAWCELWAAECLRVLRPGGHLLAFGGTRTGHRLVAGVEDAGFEVRDSIAWLYGSGFPKSLDVGKAIDKAAGASREVIGRRGGRDAYGHKPQGSAQGFGGNLRWGDTHYAWDDLPDEGKAYYIAGAERRGNITAPATAAAREWAGWGTALKPAFEPVVVARKPPVGTVAGNVQEWGTGALNIDATRVGTDTITQHGRSDSQSGSMSGRNYAEPAGRAWEGRWPANVALDGSQADALDQQSGNLSSWMSKTNRAVVTDNEVYGEWGAHPVGPQNQYGDSGGASRFFPTFRYQAKAPTTERPSYVTADGRKIAHPTVKPLGLMRWLIRLITPPGGTILDPFAGSGATLEAALIEGFPCIGIELDPDSLPLIQQRIDRQSGTLNFGEGEPA